MELKNKDVAIIGLGPSGVSAAIYLKRYGMNPIGFEKELIGGKVNKTQRIENDAGILAVSGPELGMRFETQLNDFKIEYHFKEVKEVTQNEDGTFHIRYGKDGSLDVKYVILANGLGEKPFSIPGEEKFSKRGISRCAICDGPLYKGKDVAVIGDNDAAFEEASYLATICHHVTLIARRSKFKASPALVERFTAMENAEILSPYEVIQCDGETSISSLDIRNKETQESKTLSIQALFLYVGDMPSSDFLKMDGFVNEKGFIVTDNRMETKVKNIFAIGDCRDTYLRQVATAVSDGAIAASKIREEEMKSR